MNIVLEAATGFKCLTAFTLSHLNTKETPEMNRFVGYRFVGLLLLSSSRSKIFLGLGQAGKLRVRMAETAEKQAIRMNMPRNPITGERPCIK